MFNIRTHACQTNSDIRGKMNFISHWSVVRSPNHAGILCQHTCSPNANKIDFKSIWTTPERWRQKEKISCFMSKWAPHELNSIAYWGEGGSVFCRKTARINFLFCGMEWRRAHFNCYRNNLPIFFIFIFVHNNCTIATIINVDCAINM